ncbi:hypothetical protein KKF29_00025, partial [Patescibacteria group bacterium]|nr:hypothetical protein [Patescibacteria group bacterium]
EITLKNKILWIFGMLIITGGGSGFSNGGSFGGEFGDSYTTDNEFFYGMEKIGDYVTNYWYVIALLIVALLLFGLIGLLLSIIAKASLFKGIQIANTNKKVKFWDLFKFGLDKFWRVLGIDLCVFGIVLLFLLAILILFLPFLLMMIIPIIGWIVAIIFFFAAIVAFIIFAAGLGIIINYVYCFAVLKDKKIKESFKLGYKLFKENLGESILMSLILFGINIGFLIVAIAVIFILAIPLVLVGFLLYYAFSTIGIIIAFFVGIIILGILAFLLKGIRNTYVFSSWFLTWKELSGSTNGLKVVAEKKITPKKRATKTKKKK